MEQCIFVKVFIQIIFMYLGETSIIKSQVPIFERMELAGWWTDSLKRDFPLVLKYWETIQQRFSTLLHQFCFK